MPTAELPDPAAVPPQPAEVNFGPSVEPGVACANCANYMPDSSCGALGIAVEPTNVCDLFSQSEAPPPEDMMTKLFGPGQ